MTLQHIFYIPAILLLGFIFGTIVSESKQGNTRTASSSLQHKISEKRLLYTFLIFILVFVITHIFEIPGGLKEINQLFNGVKIFDRNPVFSSDEVYERVRLFSTKGLLAYKRFTYTTDILFPISFFAFLLTFSRFVVSRIILSKQMTYFLTGLPYFWFSADLIENAVIFNILSAFPKQINFLGNSLGLITAAKFGLLLLSIFTPSLLFIFAKKNFKMS